MMMEGGVQGQSDSLLSSVGKHGSASSARHDFISLLANFHAVQRMGLLHKTCRFLSS